MYGPRHLSYSDRLPRQNVLDAQTTRAVYVKPKRYRYLSDILPNRKRIELPTLVENANKKEVWRLMQNAEVFLGSAEGPMLDELNWNVLIGEEVPVEPEPEVPVVCAICGEDPCVCICAICGDSPCTCVPL